MAKAQLSTMTKKWIDEKPSKQNDAKEQKHNDSTPKIRQTIYISKETNRLLWHHRAETGKPISSVVEDLILQNLKDKY